MCMCVDCGVKGARGDPLLLPSKNKLKGKNCREGEDASGVGPGGEDRLTSH